MRAVADRVAAERATGRGAAAAAAKPAGGGGGVAGAMHAHMQRPPAPRARPSAKKAAQQVVVDAVVVEAVVVEVAEDQAVEAETAEAVEGEEEAAGAAQAVVAAPTFTQSGRVIKRKRPYDV